MKKKNPSEPLYVIRKTEKRPNNDKTMERELLSTTFKEVALKYFKTLQAAHVRGISFTIYE